MTVRIDRNLCHGCPGRPEGCCEEICPGDLYIKKNGKAHMRDAADCWDCFACVKVCPRSALSIELPFQISETKHHLTARNKGDSIIWQLHDKSGKLLMKYIIQNRTKKDKDP